MKARAYKLMKEWCDTLLSYQVKTVHPHTNNSLLCPTCHVVHGRIADLCFPLTVLWAESGEESYLLQADALIDWTELNLKSTDGLWYNDASNRWFATSAFAAMSIGDALINFGGRLPSELYQKWLGIFVRISDTLMTVDTRPTFRPVVNYYCGIAVELAMASKITGDKKYYEKSKYWIGVALERFDRDGLLYGEGYPMEASDGSHTVDMGYNLEESLPLLLRYAEITGEYKELFRERFCDHIAFILPDGAIDNSFGTRHNKWTYWGSRTSDGIVSAFSMIADDPMLVDVCERALTLYEKCTHGGLLGMPMAEDAGEPTCLHHTFVHAKALAALFCAENVPERVERTVLPCEKPYGVKEYQNGRLCLMSDGKFRATVSAVRAMLLPEDASNGGGSLNLLYHRDRGVICAATSAEYVPSEPLNQQYLRHSDTVPCMTAQFYVDGRMGCKDKNVRLTHTDCSVTATAEKWSATYSLGDSFRLDLSSENGSYALPIVCHVNERVELSDDKKTLRIGESITVRSTAEMTVDPDKRVFNQVGGFLYLPVTVAVMGSVSVEITVCE